MTRVLVVAVLVLVSISLLFTEEAGIGIPPPREMNKLLVPAYRIEPPDVVQIDILNLVPRPPYRAEVFDVLQIRVANAPANEPIDGYFMVEAEGTINLGPSYGTVHVAGTTLEGLTKAIEKQLRNRISKPIVSVQLARVSAAQPVTGQYQVGPDGTINLRQYGVVPIAGKTVKEAKAALEKHLAQWLDAPELSVKLVDLKDKFYYVATQGAELGDAIRRFPITGDETVLDAICRMDAASKMSGKRIWIARRTKGDSGIQQILSVDWDALAQGAQTSTNYQLLPGDRLYIAEDELLTFSNEIVKAAPVDRVDASDRTTTSGPIRSEPVAGAAGSNSTIRGSGMGRNYNRTRSGF